MRNTEIKPDDIVTDLDLESFFKGKQGLVMGVQLRFWQAPEVLVRFDKKLYPMYLGPNECVNGVCEVYPPHHLRRDEDWTPETHARRLFGNSWWFVRTLETKINAESPCMVDKCPGYQKHVSWVNVSGTVLNVYLCDEHAALYKKYPYMDTFPSRQKTRTAV